MEALAAILLLVTVDLLSAATLGVVQTEGGAVEGKRHSTGLFSGVDVFKGIPFADVPKRWEKPQPHPGWTGVLKATKYKERCLQVNLLQTKTQGSEDCLYLNVFVPQGSKLSQNLPVMVYLFGGAFLLGASNDVEVLGQSLYDGVELADRGNVIVVTVNYRVGTLGFLSSGDHRVPGNFGLWDQHAAICWVKRNIHKFGGNSDNMTIFGQSAGAASVSYQMLSPHSRGLFRRAISQGGVALSPWAHQRAPFNLLKKIASKVGCWRMDVDVMISCLKMTDPVGLTMAGKIDVLLLLGRGVVMDLLELAPVVDGDFIPDEPSKLFSNAGQFDYMAGVNSMDGHIFAGVDVPSINQGNGNTTEAQVRGVLAGLTKQRSGPVLDRALDLYSSTWGAPPDPSKLKKSVADIETDFLFLVPTQIALKLHAKHSSGARTYSYLFDMKTRIPGFPAWVGAEHAEDLQYLFGKPFSFALAYFPRHRDLSRYMIQYWSNFARTGDPNSGESRVPVPWPRFTRSYKQFLQINHKMTKSSVSSDLREDYVSFWTSTYSNQTLAELDQD
ncbi:bile salt-activated lipase-like [Eucyclogobius newberryi]|uniref:bile salt-activated lipase-like n=1 Tax=Eucyclogobius newberryi TaxID=166745 RepID=UPI003B5978ED